MTSSIATPTIKTPQKPLILVAEDNIILQKKAKAALKLFFDIVIVSNGQQAADTWVNESNKRPFNVVLMDIRMPTEKKTDIQDGFEATTEIRRLEAEKAEKEQETSSTQSTKVPIIAYTGFFPKGFGPSWPLSKTDFQEAKLDETMQKKFKETEFTFVLGKPVVDSLILENVIRSVLGMSRRLSHSLPDSPIPLRGYSRSKGRSAAVSAPPYTTTEIRGPLIAATPHTLTPVEKKIAERLVRLAARQQGELARLSTISESTETEEEFQALSLEGAKTKQQVTDEQATTD